MEADKKSILTVKNIRNINIGNILRTILRDGSVVRSTLAKENDISLMTVKHIVDDLTAGGVVVEMESESSDVGRKPKVLKLSEEYGNIVCVNLTAMDEITVLIYNIYEELLDEQTIPYEESKTHTEVLMEAIQLTKEKLKVLSTKTVGIAVFVPSAYYEEEDLVNYDLIADFKELHIKALFEKEFELKNILVLHDVFSAARSEYDSPNPTMESQFYFYCGYGVGGFFIHQDVPVMGEELMAGEIGKLLLDMNGDSTAYTTVEEAVSVVAVKKKMKEQGISWKFSELLERYQQGAEDAVQILAPVLNTITKVLYNLLWVYNPKTVVIDSCKKQYAELIAEAFEERIENLKNNAMPIEAQIRCAKYDEYNMMRGCFQMVRNAWLDEIADS